MSCPARRTSQGIRMPRRQGCGALSQWNTNGRAISRGMTVPASTLRSSALFGGDAENSSALRRIFDGRARRRMEQEWRALVNWWTDRTRACTTFIGCVDAASRTPRKCGSCSFEIRLPTGDIAAARLRYLHRVMETDCVSRVPEKGNPRLRSRRHTSHEKTLNTLYVQLPRLSEQEAKRSMSPGPRYAYAPAYPGLGGNRLVGAGLHESGTNAFCSNAMLRRFLSEHEEDSTPECRDPST